MVVMLKSVSLMAGIFLLMFSGNGWCTDSQLTILPVFFVPGDSVLSDDDTQRYAQLLKRHLGTAQNHYLDLSHFQLTAFLE